MTYLLAGAGNWMSIISPSLTVIDSVAADSVETADSVDGRIVTTGTNSYMHLESGNVVGAVQVSLRPMFGYLLSRVGLTVGQMPNVCVAVRWIRPITTG